MNIPIGWQIALQILLIAINAVFAASEIAIVSVNDLKLEKMAKDGNRKAKRLVKLTSKPAKFLATIQVSITLAGFLGSAFAADNFSDIIVDALINAGADINRATLNTVSVIVITILLSYITLVFGELVPKRVAMRNPERLALRLSGLIYVSSKIFTPIVWLLTASTNLMLRIMRIDPNAEPEEVSEEEIRLLVDVGSQKGVIDADEKEMIVNVFEFDDKDCGEISTHRTDILALDTNDSIEEWKQIITGSSHSVYPVYDETIDNIVAILDSKKFLRLDDLNRDNVEKQALSEPVFVPDSMKGDDLFKQMQSTHNHFAVVLDEYGGTEGIITMNDLLEQIVGDLENEESDSDDGDEIVEISEKSWKMKGFVPLDEVEKLSDVPLPTDEFDTLNGYITALLGKIPEDSSTFTVETDKLKFDVLNVSEHTVESAVVTKL